MRRHSLEFAIASVLLVACTASAQKQTASRTIVRNASRPNIVLVTIDTLRADHVGCYGGQAETPTIDALARQGILFERGIAQVPLTWPSHASILTGTYPFHNGVQDFTGQPLSVQFRTIAEALHDHGYATGAVVSSFVLDRSWGLARGFDAYDDAFSGSDFLEKDLALVERRAGPSVDRALAWLARPRSRPFFLWLHLYDPHSPYNPPEPFRTRYRERPYDGEIAYADRELGRLVSWLKQRNLYARTAILLASDHGESLGEHGEREHGFFVYNSTVRVPLVVKLPGATKSPGTRVTRPVEIASIAPTILQIAGAADSIEKQFDVTSLLVSKVPESSTTAYSETFYPFSSFGWSPLRSLQSKDFHFIQAPRPELYDIPADPSERQDLAGAKTPMVAAMQQRLRDITSRPTAQVPNVAKPGGLDPRAQEKLQALGYVGYKAPGTVADLDKLADPKDKVGEFEAILSAADALRAGDLDKGRQLLAKAQQSDPQMYLIPFMLGEAAARQKDWAGATSNFKRALELNPAFDQAMTGLARSLHEQGNSDEARSWLEKAIKQNDKNFRAWYQLAWIQMRSAPELAAEALHRVLQIQPNFALAHRDLGMIAFQRQQYAEAARELQSASDLGLREPLLLNSLGISYSRTRRLPQAVKAYRQALGINPDLAEAHLNLGFAYQQLNNSSQARLEYDAACRLEQRLCSMIPANK